MARQKKPVNESPEQANERRVLEAVANNSDRSEKTSWNRKMNNMVSLLAKLRPIEDKIHDLEVKKLPILDEVHALRQMMIKECIHPFEHLTCFEDHVRCKFCERKISIPAGLDDGSETA